MPRDKIRVAANFCVHTNYMYILTLSNHSEALKVLVLLSPLYMKEMKTQINEASELERK